VTEFQKKTMKASTSIWNIISINGETMREAVTRWWNSSDSTSTSDIIMIRRRQRAKSLFITDCVWTKPGFCNPVCDGFPFY
jgi:hypothetical protein